MNKQIVIAICFYDAVASHFSYIVAKNGVTKQSYDRRRLLHFTRNDNNIRIEVTL